jgi:methyl-accepting chemotaxis protein
MKYNLKTRVFLGYLAPLTLLFILSGVIYSYSASREKRQQEVASSQETIIQVDRLALGLSQMLRAARAQVIFPKDTSFQNGYNNGLRLFQEAAPKVPPLIEEPEVRTKMVTLIEEGKKIAELSDQIFAAVEAGELDKAKQLTADITTRIRAGELDKLYEEVIASEQVSLAEKQAQSEAAANFLNMTVVVGTVIASATTIAMGWLISSWIIQKLQQSARNITASSSEIAATVEEQERIAHQQAASVNETTTTMDELEASFRQSAEQAKAAAIAAREALALTESGSQAVGKNLEGMFTLEQKVGTIAEQMLQLSEQASQIGSISQLVSDIANQTNMLALNSSVEAARAGEHGKGFTVVANEIRKLADQSQRSADKIGELVSQIQNAVNSTVMVTEEGTKTVTVGVEIARKTEQAFVGAADAVNQVVLNNQQISLNLKQQLDGIQQVVQAMETLNQGARESASGITQAKIGTQQLNETALELKQLV